MAQDDLQSATSTYEGFITLTKFAAVVVAVMAGIVLMLIS